MDGDDNMGEFWRDVKAASQVTRASNRQSSPDLLRAAGVPFLSKNGAAHLIIKTDGGNTVDFWPGTGLWIMRGSTQRHGGVRTLISFCKPGRAAIPNGRIDRRA